VPVGLAALGACVKEGFNNVEKLALRRYRKGGASRRVVHWEFANIEPYLRAGTADETSSAVIRRVETAVDTASLI